MDQYNDHDGISPDGAKTEFLTIVHRWPTFGSAFFEVRVSQIPSHVLVHFHPKTNLIYFLQSSKMAILVCQITFWLPSIGMELVSLIQAQRESLSLILSPRSQIGAVATHIST